MVECKELGLEVWSPDVMPREGLSIFFSELSCVGKSGLWSGQKGLDNLRESLRVFSFVYLECLDQEDLK